MRHDERLARHRAQQRARRQVHHPRRPVAHGGLQRRIEAERSGRGRNLQPDPDHLTPLVHLAQFLADQPAAFRDGDIAVEIEHVRRHLGDHQGGGRMDQHEGNVRTGHHLVRLRLDGRNRGRFARLNRRQRVGHHRRGEGQRR
ncbi:hypothetical protein [Ralstonia solanacearum]|uniref:hypothetical protein n=1 Tax=Ralstonia solanacearum TaxID=305 RepID=UPI0013C46FB7|nr:hypothetical protein [Ralstonia solanacearum]